MDRLNRGDQNCDSLMASSLQYWSPPSTTERGLDARKIMPATTAAADDWSLALQPQPNAINLFSLQLPEPVSTADSSEQQPALTSSSATSTRRKREPLEPLIVDALRQAGRRGLVLANIYRYVTDNSKDYRDADDDVTNAGNGTGNGSAAAWKKNVRHILSVRNFFIKTRERNPEGRGQFWVLDELKYAEHVFDRRGIPVTASAAAHGRSSQNTLSGRTPDINRPQEQDCKEQQQQQQQPLQRQQPMDVCPAPQLQQPPPTSATATIAADGTEYDQYNSSMRATGFASRIAGQRPPPPHLPPAFIDQHFQYHPHGQFTNRHVGYNAPGTDRLYSTTAAAPSSWFSPTVEPVRPAGDRFSVRYRPYWQQHRASPLGIGDPSTSGFGMTSGNQWPVHQRQYFANGDQSSSQHILQSQQTASPFGFDLFNTDAASDELYRSFQSSFNGGDFETSAGYRH